MRSPRRFWRGRREETHPARLIFYRLPGGAPAPPAGGPIWQHATRDIQGVTPTCDRSLSTKKPGIEQMIASTTKLAKPFRKISVEFLTKRKIAVQFCILQNLPDESTAIWRIFRLSEIGGCAFQQTCRRTGRAPSLANGTASLAAASSSSSLRCRARALRRAFASSARPSSASPCPTLACKASSRSMLTCLATAFSLLFLVQEAGVRSFLFSAGKGGRALGRLLVPVVDVRVVVVAAAVADLKA
eukprot:scaffold4776_cov87-Isochrysis_galbana.AAC.2